MAQNLKKLILITFLLFLMVIYLTQKQTNLIKKVETVSNEGYIEAFNCGQQKIPKHWTKLLCDVPLRFKTLRNASVMLSSSQILTNENGKRFIESFHFSMIDINVLYQVCSQDFPMKSVDNVTVYNILHAHSWLGSSNACVSFPGKKCCPDGVWIPPEQLNVQVAPGACLQNLYFELNKNNSRFMICDAPSTGLGWSSSYAKSKEEKSKDSQIKYSFVAYCAITLYFISGSLRRHLIETYFTGF